MGKSPGFWFFTGDWLKDSELRFCSLFARGLLMDLLCLMFEAKQQGYLSKPDGTARSDEDIADAVSGSTRDLKLQALKELESSGVLSRDENGVLFSRRLARLGDISQKRSKAGSKGGSKTKAKPKQNDEQTPQQTDQQNTGVTVSDSDSVSVFNTHTHPQGRGSKKRIEIPPEIAEHWVRWAEFRFAIDGRAIPEPQIETILMDLGRRGWEKAKRDIDFSIRKTAKNILDSDNDYERKSNSSSTGTQKRKQVGI